MPIRLRVRQGDIAAFEGDAVVNAANNHLLMGAGVAGALARRGGPGIQAACDEVIRRHGPLRVGDAALTEAGNLSARFVIHAAAMGDEPASERSIRQATRSALEQAAAHDVCSLAFPILGAGIGGHPFEWAVREMLDEIRTHAVRSPLPETVTLYGYTGEQAATLRALVGELTAPNPPNAPAP